MASGALPASTAAAMAAATGTPGRASPMSPMARTLLAPYSPSSAATASASVPAYTASTESAMARALVSSSSVVGVTLPSEASASTQILERVMVQGLLEDLEVVEIGDDLLEAGAVVLDDLSGL